MVFSRCNAFVVVDCSYLRVASLGRVINAMQGGRVFAIKAAVELRTFECVFMASNSHRFWFFQDWQGVTCIEERCQKVTVSNESALTETGQTSRVSRFYEDDGAGTLAQVVSKYVCIDGPCRRMVGSDNTNNLSAESSKCLLSTQVPYSEDSSTSSVSPSADTATSPDSASVVVPDSDVNLYCSVNQNPDNLQSILPSNMNLNQQQGEWASNVTRLRSLEVPASWSGVACEPSETWSNLCELPAAWQYYTDPGLVASEMEVELVDVTRDLAMRSCEAGSPAAWQSFQDDGCDGCFLSADWRFPEDSSISCVSDTSSDEYLRHDIDSGKGTVHDQLLLFPVEQIMGYDILGIM
jgi:hypothetical protein